MTSSVTRKFEAQGALYGFADLLLLRGRGDLRILEQADDRQAGVGWMKVGARSHRRHASNRDMRPGWLSRAIRCVGALIGGLAIGLLVRRSVELCRSHQRAIVVEDVFVSIVQQFAIVRVEELESLFGCAEIVGAGKIASSGMVLASASAAMAIPPPARKLAS